MSGWNWRHGTSSPRAIVHEMSAEDCDHVLLDISHKPAAEIRRRFPNILDTCRAFGFDLTAEPIPVVPAAHYTCGGVVTDSGGGTDIRHLYAAGEVGCTGLHGANRLASNSLLEALAFAKSVSTRIDERIRRRARRRPRLPTLVGSYEIDRRDLGWAKACATELRRIMWEHVGIVRTRESLAEAAGLLANLERRVAGSRDHRRLHPDLLELENLVAVSRLITESAARRHESRGLHYNLDYPRMGPLPKDSALRLSGIRAREAASR